MYRLLIAVLLFTQSWLIIPAIDFAKPVGFVPIVDRDPSTNIGHYDTSDLNYGVGRLEGMAWGSDYGRIMIAGHTPGAFDRIDQLEVGDVIYLLPEYGEMQVFVITSTYSTVPSDDSILKDPVSAGEGLELVLITCADNETKRLIIRARRIED